MCDLDAFDPIKTLEEEKLELIEEIEELKKENEELEKKIEELEEENDNLKDSKVKTNYGFYREIRERK